MGELSTITGAASAASAAASAYTGDKILGWCITMASVVFGVFGFVYGTHAAAMLGKMGHVPVVKQLSKFAKALSWMLISIFALSVWVAANDKAPVEVWLLLLILAVIAGFIYRFAEKTQPPGS